MPLLSRRRSTLDFLAQELRPRQPDDDDKADTQSEGRAKSERSPIIPRAHSEHALRSNPPVFGGDGAGSPVLGVAKPVRRFTNRLSRHFSDSHLAARARIAAESEDTSTPPVPAIPAEMPPPTIMTTAPTADFSQEPGKKKKLRGNPFKRQKSRVESIASLNSDKAMSPEKEQTKSVFSWGRKSMDTRRNPSRLSVSQDPDESLSPSPRPSDASLAPPVLRESKSSEFQSASNPKPKKPSLFTLPKRDKDKRKSLFPLPPKIDPPPQYPDTAPATPRESTSGMSHRSVSPTRRRSPTKREGDSAIPDSSSLRTSASNVVLGKGNVSFAHPHPLVRNDSNRSIHSASSSPVAGHPLRLGIRDRASTNSTFGRPSDDVTPPTPPTLNGSTRNSTSTSGRASLGGFLTLNRFRTDGTGVSPGSTSKSNSMTISRDTIALPERADGETAAKYLERLQSLASRNVIAGMLSKSSDPFFQNVLRSYTRRFAFFGEPIDMSLRKFLLEADLPKETQQVDRVIQAFADRYHECNPGIFVAPGLSNSELPVTRKLTKR